MEKETHLRGTCDLGSWAHPDSPLAPPDVPAGALHPGNMRTLLAWRMSYWLNEIRCQSGYSQRELAGLIETTQPALSKWETGRNLISLDVLGRLGACTQIPIALYAELPGSRRESVIWL